MAAHRYWRAVAMEAYGAGDLELSCFHLLDTAGVRVDADAALTVSSAPTTGVIANLQDDDLSTAARWPAQSVASLALVWDFGGTPVDVMDIRMAGNSEWRFPLIVKMQWSDDAAAWTNDYTFAGITYPGAWVKTLSSTYTAGWAHDPDFSRVVLLLQDSLIDKSPTPKAVSALGATAVTTVQSKFGGSSFYFDGAAGGITLVASSDFNLGTGDFTIEFQAYPLALVSGAAMFSLRMPSGAGGGIISLQDNGTVGFSDGIVWRSTTSTLTVGLFKHVALARQSGLLRIFINGVMGFSGSVTVDIAGDRPCCLGRYDTSTDGGFFNGYIDEVRVTKGLARYTENFSPPTVPRFTGGVLLNKVEGRALATDLLTIVTGPTIIYGTPKLLEPVSLGVEAGSVKDFTSGVLGKGIGRVSGTVKKKGTPANTPVYCKVRLIREKDGLQMREVWSHPVTGAYSFDYIDELQKFTVLSYDHTGAFRAVVADGQIPEIMS